MSLIRVEADGKLTPSWDVTWYMPNRQPLHGQATYVRGDGIKEYLVRFKKGDKWIKETELEF